MTLPLTPIVNITYSISPVGAIRAGFDTGLIIGQSSIISTGTRVVVYSSLAEILTAGFSPSSPEYLAAQAYFGSTGRPTKVALGRWGTGETALQAITACRAANSDWYIGYIPNATNSDHIAIAPYVEALTEPYTTYFVQNGDAAVKNATGGNLFETLKAALYRRTLGIYSTSNYAAASLMGYPMGKTSILNNSAYTLNGKTLPGITPEVLTTQQTLNIEGNNGNIYVNRGVFYNWFELGTMFNGTFFDEVIYLDQLINNIQINAVNLLYQTPKVPQTDAGVAELRAVIAAACNSSRNIGFIAPGQWNGQQILTLNPGDYLPEGYLVLSDSIVNQTQADRTARKSPPIYVAVKEAGAIHDVVIAISVNQ